MARSYALADRIASRAKKEAAAKEDFVKAQNAHKALLRELRKQNRLLLGQMMDREGFLDLPTAELAAGLDLLKVIRELALLSNPAEAERRLREPTGRSVARDRDKEDLQDILAEVESVAALASAAE